MKPEKKQTVLIVHNYYQIPGGEDTVVANEEKMLTAAGYTNINVRQQYRCISEQRCL